MSAREETRSTFESTTGGVMTVEAGAITGPLDISTLPTGGALEARVRYAGAEEWYTVEGSPAALQTARDLSPSELHERVVEHLGQPGQVVSGNEESRLPARLLYIPGQRLKPRPRHRPVGTRGKCERVVKRFSQRLS